MLKQTSVAVVAAVALLAGSAAADDWQEGYVLAGVSGGNYNVYDNDGNFIETINTGLGGFTTGGAFDGGATRFFGTDFSASSCVVFDRLHPHGILQTVSSVAFGGAAMESVVFDASGNFYTGHAGGNGDIIKFDSTGAYVAQFDALVGPRGTDWIDLSTDQQTMFYTSEGRLIRRYDVVNDVQLADFATLPGGGASYALRLLGPSFDGSDGLLVADSSDIKRLDAAGNVVQTYGGGLSTGWFAMNLDSNGASFWAGEFITDNFYRFNIASGAIEVGPINAGPGGSLFGLIVLGEISGGNLPPRFDDPTPCDETFEISAGTPLSFDVVACDENVGDIVTLDVTGLPAGATMTPTLPLDGNPVASSFEWTATNADAGTHVMEFTATDLSGNQVSCEVTVVVENGACAGIEGARDTIAALPDDAFATLDPWWREELLKRLECILIVIERNGFYYWRAAEALENHVLTRLDGVALRGRVDPRGKDVPDAPDYVIDPVVQVELYACLLDALSKL